MQRLRETLTIILLTVLPFHAFLVTVSTRMIMGPNHSPLMELALWKEGVLALILLLASIELLRRGRKLFAVLKPDVLDVLILLLIALSLAVTNLNGADWKLYLFGFKYDFVPLVSFMILRRVSWSENFMQTSISFILVIAAIISLLGIVTFFLPHQFFMMLGYADLHSLYVPDAPLAPYQQIGGLMLRRVQSVMSGPNQLGLWLLLPWALAWRMFCNDSVNSGKFFTRLFEKLRLPAQSRKFSDDFLLVLIGVTLILTFSRSAWIGAIIIMIGSFILYLPREQWEKILVRMGGLVLALILMGLLFKPEILIRAASSMDHIERPLQAIELMKEHPFGLGMGTAGPASNRVSDACVYLENGADVVWAEAHPDLCVFVGGIQVQPAGACTCPNLPENWYLQIGIELGIAGFLLFVVFVALLLGKLSFSKRDASQAVFLSALGVSVAALFLHAWEDAAVAYTLWIAMAIVLQGKTDSGSEIVEPAV